MTRKTTATSKPAPLPRPAPLGGPEADVALWKEALFGAELLLLHASPVFYGLGVPRGDGSAVVVVPGFLGSDIYMTHLTSWLRRIGYMAYVSGIPLNADCPNLLIKYQLSNTVDRARRQTRRKVHLVGHSLGGVMARSLAAQRPADVASVITLGSPFQGTVLHHTVMKVASAVRQHIIQQHGDEVLPDCYTSRCTCEFVSSLKCAMAERVAETAIYTRDDGVADWRYCRTGDKTIDFEVSGTHVGLVFNPAVYSIIAERLAQTPAASRRSASSASRGRDGSSRRQ